MSHMINEFIVLKVLHISLDLMFTSFFSGDMRELTQAREV